MFLEVTLLLFVCEREAQHPFSSLVWLPALHLAHPTKPHHLWGFKLVVARVQATMPIINPSWMGGEVTVATLTMDPEWAPTCSKGLAVEGHCMVLAIRKVVSRAKSGGLLIPIMTVLITQPWRTTLITNIMVLPLTPLISLFILISKRMAESEKKWWSQKRMTLHLHFISRPSPLPVHHHLPLPLPEKMAVENSLYIIKFHHCMSMVLDPLMLQAGNRRRWGIRIISPHSILGSSTTLEPTLAIGSTKLRHTGARGLVAVM